MQPFTLIMHGCQILKQQPKITQAAVCHIRLED